MTVYIQPTKAASLVLHILKMRGQVHNCPFESIWFAISQPLCIMYMSNIYIHFMQISDVSCIWPNGCPCLFMLNTRHNSIEGISFARDLLVTVNPVSSPLMFMFWNRNWVFKLTTIDVPSGLQTRNFQSSVIHSNHEFSLIGKLNVYICKTLKPNYSSCSWGYWPAHRAGLLFCNFFDMLTSVPYHHFFSSLILLFIYV